MQQQCRSCTFTTTKGGELVVGQVHDVRIKATRSRHLSGFPSGPGQLARSRERMRMLLDPDRGLVSLSRPPTRSDAS